MNSESLLNRPVLYSFRRCPYAMRARLALARADVRCELREILLKDKPAEMLALSEKGTVPVLLLKDGRVLDESLEIMLWSTAQNDPDNWLVDLDASLELVQKNDEQFKHWLDRYKYHVGYPEHSQEYYRDAANEFIGILESRLTEQKFLLDEVPRLADLAIFPFVRQFAFVDLAWFESSQFRYTNAWLRDWLNTDLFAECMMKHELWVSGTKGVSFPSGKQPA